MEEHKQAAQSSCDYTAGAGEITIALVHSSSKLHAEEELAALKKLLPDGAVREAHGIGTQAFFIDIPNAGAHFTSCEETMTAAGFRAWCWWP